MLSVVPPMSLAVLLLTVLSGVADAAAGAIAVAALLVGFVGFPVSVYRMGSLIFIASRGNWR